MTEDPRPPGPRPKPKNRWVQIRWTEGEPPFSRLASLELDLGKLDWLMYGIAQADYDPPEPLALDDDDSVLWQMEKIRARLTAWAEALDEQIKARQRQRAKLATLAALQQTAGRTPAELESAKTLLARKQARFAAEDEQAS